MSTYPECVKRKKKKQQGQTKIRSASAKNWTKVKKCLMALERERERKKNTMVTSVRRFKGFCQSIWSLYIFCSFYFALLSVVFSFVSFSMRSSINIYCFAYKYICTCACVCVCGSNCHCVQGRQLTLCSVSIVQVRNVYFIFLSYLFIAHNYKAEYCSRLILTTKCSTKIKDTTDAL